MARVVEKDCVRYENGVAVAVQMLGRWYNVPNPHGKLADFNAARIEVLLTSTQRRAEMLSMYAEGDTLEAFISGRRDQPGVYSGVGVNCTGDTDYYDALMKMWDHIKGAKNGYKGQGGLAWKTDLPASRMSCSNGPGCLLAMKLYQLTVKEAKEGWEAEAEYYLNFAKEVYTWMTAYLCDISTGQVYDNLGINDDGTVGDPDKVALSYNQGTFMASALELYNATGVEDYLRNAVSFASYQVNHKMDSNYPVFSGEGGSGDNLLFRGIFVRYFLDLLKQPTGEAYPEKTKNKFIAALRSCSDVLWVNGHPEGWYVWEYDWTKAPEFGNRNDNENRLTISLNAEVPGATLIEIRARYEDWVQGKETEKANWIGPDFATGAE
jgi:hypothetical protein